MENSKLIEEVEGLKDIGGVVEKRNRNTRIITLIEGDILVRDEEYYHVSEGEVSVYADGTIDEKRGELAPVEQDAIGYAIAAGATVFNMEDV